MNSFNEIAIGFSLVYEIALGMFFIKKVFPSEKSKRSDLLIGIYFILYVAIILFEEYYISSNISDAYFIYLGIHFCMLVGFSFVCKKGTLIFKIYYPFIYLSMLLLVGFPSLILSRILLNNNLISEVGSTALLRFTDCIFLTFILNFLLHFQINSNKKYPLSMHVVMLSSAITNLISFNMFRPLYDNYDFVAYIGLMSLAMEVFIYFMIWQSTTEYNSRITLELMAQQEDYQTKHMNELKNIVEEYHKLRHDTKNQYAIMDRLISQEKYTELRNYFYSLTKDIYELDNQIETGNEIVNQVINIKYASAHQLGIPMDIHIILPSELSIPDYALCSLLSNLIDNAIEASAQIENPQITIKMYVKKSYLCLKISNRIENWQSETALSHVSSKREQGNHGLGWQIIQEMINKNNGIYSYYIEDDMYITEVMYIV